jgi:hypothetical protein
MLYPNYLIHFNKNHSPKNGQFTNGDGDGDGQVNDNKRVKEKKISYLRKLKNAFMEGVNEGVAEQQRMIEEQQRIAREQMEQMEREGRQFTQEEIDALNYNQQVMNQQMIENGNQFMKQMNYNAQLQNQMFFM